ncbi:YgiW/YdeI family stress tolerance OB fold protein [Rodentibacter caecimuris]|uniref:TIGR00156 family protein n=1 Tax=Rodentibacter caecimuris TaxID=1796644 RepID=A0ABX3KWC2_9PAST|nr:TIGR00156 family protein [Rodentibacter heylii]
MAKKLTLALLLGLSTTVAFAGFQGNSNHSRKGGFTQRITIKQALSEKDDTMVTLVGNISRQVDKDKYIFTDGTDEIKIEVDRKVWGGLNVGPQDKIRILGKLDNEVLEKADIDVIRIEKAN